MASRPARPAITDDGAGGGVDSGRLARTASWGDEPRWSVALDSLAGTIDPDPAGGRQLLLHGLPIYCPADSGPSLAAGGQELAAVVAEQMAGRAPIDRVPVGLRGIQPVGQPLVDGLARDRILRPGLRYRRPVPRRRILQIRLPHRA